MPSFLFNHYEELTINPPSHLHAESVRTQQEVQQQGAVSRHLIDGLSTEISAKNNDVNTHAAKLANIDSHVGTLERSHGTMAKQIAESRGSVLREVDSKFSARNIELNVVKSGISDAQSQARVKDAEIMALETRINVLNSSSNDLSAVVNANNQQCLSVDSQMAMAMARNVHLQSDTEAIEVSVGGMVGDGTDYVDIVIGGVLENLSRKAFTAGTDDVITCAGHGYANWLRVPLLENSGGALPAGLSGSQVYYIILIDEDTFKLTVDKPGTDSPTPVDITDTGTGTHKITVATPVTHSWMSLEPVVSIADTIADLDLTYVGFAPETGDVRWKDSEEDKPRFVNGGCNIRIYFPVGTYLATETATLTTKIASDSKLMSNTVDDLDVVITFVS